MDNWTWLKQLACDAAIGGLRILQAPSLRESLPNDRIIGQATRLSFSVGSAPEEVVNNAVVIHYKPDLTSSVAGRMVALLGKAPGVNFEAPDEKSDCC